MKVVAKFHELNDHWCHSDLIVDKTYDAYPRIYKTFDSVRHKWRIYVDKGKIIELNDNNFKKIFKTVEDIREDKLNTLGI